MSALSEPGAYPFAHVASADNSDVHAVLLSYMKLESFGLAWAGLSAHTFRLAVRFVLRGTLDESEGVLDDFLVGVVPEVLDHKAVLGQVLYERL